MESREKSVCEDEILAKTILPLICYSQNINPKTMKKSTAFNFLPISLFIVSLLLFANSCKTPKIALPEDYSVTPIEMPFEVLSIDIIDKRNMPLKSMMWQMKGDMWVGNPELSQTNRNDIENIIQRTSKEDGIQANIEFRILEGALKMDGSALEYVTFKGELEVTIPGEKLPFTSHAEIRYEKPADKTNEAFAMDLYNLAVRNVTDATLKEMKKSFKGQ